MHSSTYIVDPFFLLIIPLETSSEAGKSISFGEIHGKIGICIFLWVGKKPTMQNQTRGKRKKNSKALPNSLLWFPQMSEIPTSKTICDIKWSWFLNFLSLTQWAANRNFEKYYRRNKTMSKGTLERFFSLKWLQSTRIFSYDGEVHTSKMPTSLLAYFAQDQLVEIFTPPSGWKCCKFKWNLSSIQLQTNYAKK